MQLRLDRTDVDLERCRDLFELHLGVETETKDLSLTRWQLSLLRDERGDGLFLHRPAFRPCRVVRHPYDQSELVIALRILIDH